MRWTPSITDAAGNPWTAGFVATDTRGAQAFATSRIIVQIPTNQPPILEPVPDRVLAPGESLVLEVRATDPDGPPPLVLGASPLPMGASFADLGGGRGEFRWTPSAGQSDAGTWAVTFTAGDGDGGLSADLTRLLSRLATTPTRTGWATHATIVRSNRIRPRRIWTATARAMPATSRPDRSGWFF
jgi:hypothetical protein